MHAADKQTDRRTDSKILPTPIDVVGVVSKYKYNNNDEENDIENEFN